MNRGISWLLEFLSAIATPFEGLGCEGHLRRTAKHVEEWFEDLSQRPLSEHQRFVVRGRNGATIATNTTATSQSTFNQW